MSSLVLKSCSVLVSYAGAHPRPQPTLLLDRHQLSQARARAKGMRMCYCAVVALDYSTLLYSQQCTYSTVNRALNIQMLLNVERKAWTEGLQTSDFSELETRNEATVKQMLNLAQLYNKARTPRAASARAYDLTITPYDKRCTSHMRRCNSFVICAAF